MTQIKLMPLPHVRHTRNVPSCMAFCHRMTASKTRSLLSTTSEIDNVGASKNRMYKTKASRQVARKAAGRLSLLRSRSHVKVAGQARLKRTQPRLIRLTLLSQPILPKPNVNRFNLYVALNERKQVVRPRP